jgi:hypothetical protein
VAVLAQAIDKALAAIPPDKHGAVIASYDLQGGVSLAVVARIGDQWSFVGRLSHTLQPGAALQADAEARFTW